MLSAELFVSNTANFVIFMLGGGIERPNEGFFIELVGEAARAVRARPGVRRG
jgi:hypothetical protein